MSTTFCDHNGKHQFQKLVSGFQFPNVRHVKYMIDRNNTPTFLLDMYWNGGGVVAHTALGHRRRRRRGARVRGGGGEAEG